VNDVSILQQLLHQVTSHETAAAGYQCRLFHNAPDVNAPELDCSYY
jgi:hypothetical protein